MESSLNNIYHPTVLELEVWDKGAGRFSSFWGLWGRICSIPLASGGFLAIFSVLWLVDTSSRFLPSCSHSVLLMSMSIFTFPLFCKDTIHFRLRVHPTPGLPHLNSTNYILHFRWPHFQVRTHSEVLGVRNLTQEFGAVGGGVGGWHQSAQ